MYTVQIFFLKYLRDMYGVHGSNVCLVKLARRITFSKLCQLLNIKTV